MAGREVKVVISAQDKASGPLGVVAGRIRSFRDASDHAGQGLGRINNILGDISRTALGATGPLGRVAEKLIELGIGGGAFLLIAGGIAAIVTLYQKMTQAAREAREETDKLVTSLFKLSPAGQHEERVKELDRLNTRIKAIKEELDTSNPFRKALGLGPSAEEAKKLNAELLKLTYLRDRLLTVGALELPELSTTTSGDKKAKELQARIDAIVEKTSKQLVIETASTTVQDTRSTGAERVSEGDLPDWKANTEAALDFHGAMGLIAEITPAVAEGLDAINNSLLGSIPGFGMVAKAAQKAVQIVAKVEGSIAIAKGAVKLAESIWPFNPAGIASGSKMIAEGAKLAALGGGGGGGGGGASGGGSGFAQSATQTQQATRLQEVRIKANPGDILNLNSPGGQRILAEAIRAAAYARTIEIDLTGAA